MKYYLTTLICLLAMIINGQEYSLHISKIDSKVSLDGLANEAFWKGSQKLNDFTTFQPNPDQKQVFDTEVRMAYDDEAIYVYIKAYGTRDSINKQVTKRDDLGNVDWVAVAIDPYRNATDGFQFIVGATGVQYDAKISSNNEDDRWDAVWASAVTQTDDYWAAEIKLPYSAIRFPDEDVQLWNINFMRNIAITGTKASWHPLDVTQPLWMVSMGSLMGLKDIKPPLRLSISPYLSSAASTSTGSDGSNSNSYSYAGGLDIKYGINDAFTLDATLIPDFGQVRSDDNVVNLSPFEIRFQENRQFFTEGTELFNKADLFYSRRIGSQPQGYYDVVDKLDDGEHVIENPSKTQLLNASKLSGRTSGGLGIGVFNAITKQSNAIVADLSDRRREIMTNPLTNYNIVVLDQNLPNNSSVSLTNTNVTRLNDSYHNANVTATTFDLRTKGQKFFLSGKAAVSHLDRKTDADINGYRYELSMGRSAGNLNYSLNTSFIDDRFNSNDLGFLNNNNEQQHWASVSYSVVKPFGPFARGNFWLNYTHSRLVNPNETSANHFNWGYWMQSKSLYNFNMWFNYRPTNIDWFEARVSGVPFDRGTMRNGGMHISTDYTKRVRLSGYVFYRDTDDDGRYGFSYGPELNMQLSNRLTLGLDHEQQLSYQEPGYVTQDEDDIIFGYRNRSTVINSLNTSYTFSPVMSIDARVRHYWTKVYYDGFATLDQSSGDLRSSDYNENQDFDFDFFNVDLNFKWRFAPGSDMIVSWRNSISGSEERINQTYQDLSYSKGLNRLGNLPQTNTVSVRVVYYLDYLMAFR